MKKKPTAKVKYSEVPAQVTRTRSGSSHEEEDGEVSPQEVADSYIPLQLETDIDWEGADAFVWHSLLVAVAEGDVPAMRVWLTTRREQLYYSSIDADLKDMSLEELRELDQETNEDEDEQAQ